MPPVFHEAALFSLQVSYRNEKSVRHRSRLATQEHDFRAICVKRDMINYAEQGAATAKFSMCGVDNNIFNNGEGLPTEHRVKA